MSLDTENKSGSSYDDKLPGKKDSLEEAYSAPAIADKDRNTNKSASRQDLANDESSASTPQSSPAENSEQQLGKGYTGNQAKKGTFKTISSSLTGKKGLIAGVAALGGIGVIGSLIALFGFLNIFRLEHLLKNVESVTQTRLRASLDSRNDHLVRAYIKLRMTDYNSGTNNNGPLFFRANKVDTNNPIRDWYRTMRTSNFEDDLFQKQGIKFTSIVSDDGKIQLGKISVKDQPDINFEVLKRQDINFDELIKGNVSEFNKLGPDLDKFVDTTLFESHKDARKIIKTTINDNTHWWQVMKRRHIRRDVYNMVGIKSWKIFEKTRNGIALKRQESKDRLLNKIINKYYANNPSTTIFMKCLFSNGPCSSSSDPAAPDQKANSIAVGDNIEPDKQAGIDENGEITDVLDENGNPMRDLDTRQTGNDIQDATTKALKGEVTGLSDEAATKLTPNQKIIQNFVSIIVGSSVDIASTSVNPTKIWTWAKRLAKIDNLVHGGTLIKMVKNSRRAQLVGIYASYAIANSQIKSGELIGDEVGDLMGSLKNVGNTEGWNLIAGKDTAGSVSAQSTNNTTKEEYCSPGHEKKDDEYAWLCDSQKPNNGGTAETITKVYDSSVGLIIRPIAIAVNTVSKSIFGLVANFVSGLMDTVVGTFLNPVVSGFMNVTNLDSTIQTFVGAAMQQLLSFLGAGPMFDGNTPGAPNLIASGSAAEAESSTRASGGIESTPESLKYSNAIASNYKLQNKNTSTFERYADINNPDSLIARSLFTASDNEVKNNLNNLVASLFSGIPGLFGSLLSGRVFAQTATQSPSAVADWAGVETYDIPQACINYDLFSATPENGTNFPQIAQNYDSGANIQLDWDTVRDTDKFYKKVYDWAGTDQNKIKAALTIYNCNLLDARSMGNLGAIYGYTQDGGM